MIQTNEEVFSHILICQNMEKAKEHLEEKYSSFRHLFYEKEEFLLEDAKELVKEAYIAESAHKYLIACAKSYRTEAQNALLKILEEPPRNIVFIMCAPSKSAFLPTIRSRLVVQELKIAREEMHSGLALKTLTIAQVYEFVRSHQHLDKNGLKQMVQSIVCEAIEVHNIHFIERELDYFQRLIHLCDLNAKAQTILIALLLAIMQRKHR